MSGSGYTELRLRVQNGTGGARDVVVDADDSATVGAVLDAVAERLASGTGHANGHGPAAAYCARTGASLLRDASLADAGLRNGDKILLGARPASNGHANGAPGRRFDLVVVGGPLSGHRIGLQDGRWTIGRGSDCDLVLDDPSISRRHLSVEVGGDGVAVADAGSSNGTFVGVRPLRRGETRVAQGADVFRVGRTLVSFEPARDEGDALNEDPFGNVPFNRPPRVARPWKPPRFPMEAPPSDPPKVRLPLAAALAPLLIGVVLYAVTKQATLLLFTALTPVMAVWTYVEDRRSGRRTHREDMAAFERDLQQLDEKLAAALADELHERRLGAPDAAELSRRAINHLPTLWERRTEDADFLQCRLGVADQPTRAAIDLPPGGSKELRARITTAVERHQTVPAAPVVVSVADAGVVGLGGARQRVDALARWILLQAATLHSPRDLVVVAAVAEPRLRELEWLKWLPHTRSDTSPVDGPHLATGKAGARALVKDLLALQKLRRQEANDRFGESKGRPSPFVLAIVDEDVAPERSLVAEMLSHSAEGGIAVVWLGSTMRDLPGECRVVVELEDGLSKLALTDARTGDVLPDVAADGVGRSFARDVALALAPVRDTSTTRARGQIPRRSGLLDVLDLAEPRAERIAEEWHRAGRDLAAPIGVAAQGAVSVDLRDDGPHALIGGTTGAGKSELLQTLVASLAARHAPDRLTFLLIDYKGGAAFKDCVALPHCVGFVTDLDPHLSQRALTSLNAELRRREHLLRGAGAKDLADMERRSPLDAPPSLVIVVDEFATLAKEVPDFVDGIVDVAQRGRSLGVHLVLATQRPGGAVSDNIRANVNLRIALRMSDGTESTDVIGVADAARIPRSLPGRAYLRTGHSELVEVQTAYAGGITGSKAIGPAIAVTDFDFDQSQPQREATRSVVAATVQTDLQRLVKAIAAAAEVEAIEPPLTPWLPALPSLLPLAQAEADVQGDGDPTAWAALGRVDEPEVQRQRTAVHDFQAEGSLLVYGSSGAGKTTLLRTIAASLAGRCDPGALHLYGLDFASRGLLPLEELPHCGGVVVGEDEERVTRLLNTLRRTLAERRDRFAALGAFSLSEYNAAAPESGRLPRIVVLLDGFAGFTAAFERVNLGELVDLLPRLVAEGRPLGLHFVITADRRGAIGSGLTGVVPGKLVLRMADEDDYASLGLDARALRGVKLPPGRGFFGNGLELQCAVPGDEAGSDGQLSAIASLARRAAAEHPGLAAPPVRLLPVNVPDELPPARDPLHPVLGIGDTDLAPVAADLSEAHFLVAGPYRSGRSTALAALARSIRAADPRAELHLLSPRRSPLREMAVWASVSRGVEECEAKAGELAGELESLAPGGLLVVVIDDGDDLAESLVAAPLETIVRRGRDLPVRVIAASEIQAVARAYNGWLRELRKEEQGLLLDPDLDVDGDVLGVRLPRRTNMTFPPGRGFLVRRGTAELVQVAGQPATDQRGILS